MAKRQIKALGWGFWNDWGSARRGWEFVEDVPELGASKGNELYDRGPRYGEARFSLRKEDGTRVTDPCPVDVVTETLFIGVLPAWDPPRAGDRMIAKAIKGLAANLTGFASGQGSKAEETLRKMQGLLEEARRGTVAETPEPTATENRYLRLKFDGQYDNGDPYQDYELLLDAPMIPATRTRLVEGPRHAIKGDLIRVIDDGDRFSLRRGNRSIGSPEWWQLKDIFVGISVRGETEEESRAESEPEDSVLRALRQLLPEGPHKSDNGSPLWYDAYYAGEGIDGTPIREGDFLLHARYLNGDRFTREERAAIHGSVMRVPRSVFPKIAQHLESFRYIESNWGEDSPREHIERFRKYLRNPAALRASDATSPILIIRQLRSPVGEPIAALSDDAALFELIYSTGGRMPKEVTQ